MPEFVRNEFEAYLRCGIPAEGFARVHCRDCGYDHILPFSCKGRSWCPSCLGRRMNEGAAFLVDRVLGDTPMRHWVLSLPIPLRYLLAYDSELCGEVLGAFVKAIFRWLRWKAKSELGLSSVEQAHPGSVTAIQRASSHLALNVHFHTLTTDGVFVREEPDGPAYFCELPPPTEEEVGQVAWETCKRTREILIRRGLWEDEEETPGEDPLSERDPGLAGLYQDSIRGVISLGKKRGRSIVFFGEPAWDEDPAAKRTGYSFNLHASQATRAGDRVGLERLCRYVLRPPLASDRLIERPDGLIFLRFKKPWSDGSEGVLFEPLDLLAKLAALVPPPRMHILRFHGVYAPGAHLRAEVVPELTEDDLEDHHIHGQESQGGSRSGLTWSQLIKRIFQADALECPRCGSRMQIIAFITSPPVIRKILRSVGLPADSPPIHPARTDELLDPAA